MSTSNIKFTKTKINHLKEQDLIRTINTIENRKENQVVIKGKSYINFSSNDYLSLSDNQEIKEAFIEGVKKYGLGSTSSPMIVGHYSPTKILEEKFAEFLGREKAILFNSGYHANIGVINSLSNKETSIFSDKLCHASIIDGILLSKAKHYRYLHNDTSHLSELFYKYKSDQNLIITESIFSMEGDFSHLPEILKITKNNNGILYVDDAHGIGILGKHGAGITEKLNLSEKEVPLLVIPLGKAFGSMGAIVSGKKELIELLIQSSRSYIYSTALPPAISYGTLKALEIIKSQTWRREKLEEIIDFFILKSKEFDIPLVSYDRTPIKSILIGKNKETLKIQSELRENGLWTSAIRPPTVPQNTSRLRISLNCMHTKPQILKLLSLIAKYKFQANELN